MAVRTTLILTLTLVAVAMVAIPTGEAQQPSNILQIQGTVFCSVNGTVGPGTPPFANATVQLQCNGSVVAEATTNATGNFTIVVSGNIPMVRGLPLSLGSMISNCSVVVDTPLATCNSNLPSVILQSLLRFFGISVDGLITVFIISTSGFSPPQLL